MPLSNTRHSELGDCAITRVQISSFCFTKHIPFACICNYQAKANLIECNGKDNLLIAFGDCPFYYSRSEKGI